ncbi:hypothetical protein [Longimicrobium terrae]|uniref:Uncharacterized protein n=1 Tax=Longimicrobium terrae TaxID=1639882 RepID=A0A841GUV7_9BACT|nr:hypothetical protein [Longimicrobium terrae]MBB4634116.1 hypothetical protein [Longimicrobium terrae]MBB6068994.1 hypothetical protein [Longimicrobium terrae]NNC28172.1 hypothetical protein [Longimicrobium terrae]
MNTAFRFRAAGLAAVLLLGACRGEPTGRLVLRADAAATLGLRATAFAGVDSSSVPRAARDQAARVRDALGGGRRAVRFYASDDGEIATLIPARSFEGEDPHVVAGLRTGAADPAKTILYTYDAVESYCPAEGALGAHSVARDSADGCRYFSPVPIPPAAAPPPR